MDSLGRRKTIMLGAFINLVGAILQSAAQNLAMILVGRIMAGWAVGVLSMSVPIYQSECAHPKTRGMSRRCGWIWGKCRDWRIQRTPELRRYPKSAAL
jgi:MFS family permease